jgi:acyl carrier protein
MDTKPLLDELADLLAVHPDDINAQSELATFGNWDSLTKVTLIGFLVDQYGVHVDPERMDHLKTVSELLLIVQELSLAAAS